MRNPVSKSAEPQTARESIFGPAAGSFFAQLVTIAVALCVVLCVLYLGILTKDKARHFLYGDAPPTLEPGQSAIVDGVTIKRIN